MGPFAVKSAQSSPLVSRFPRACKINILCSTRLVTLQEGELFWVCMPCGCSMGVSVIWGITSLGFSCIGGLCYSEPDY
jgi:hypothetical protein